MAAHSQSTVAAILVAAGSGERLGAPVPKAFVEVRGRSLLQYALPAFTAHPGIGQVIVVAPATHVDAARASTGLDVVAGGVRRQDSVAAGLAALAPNTEFVLVHDVARPFVPSRVLDAVLDALRAGAVAVVPVVPIADTVRSVAADGMLSGVVDRAGLVAVQTPQGFRSDVLIAAHAAASDAATDDAALVEALGHQVESVPGADEAFKITTPTDLARADSIAALSSTTGGPS
jgi:2-C-methyl-D-erythritol 4-phosphate cytidylyltransferase